MRAKVRGEVYVFGLIRKLPTRSRLCTARSMAGIPRIGAQVAVSADRAPEATGTAERSSTRSQRKSRHCEELKMKSHARRGGVPRNRR